MIKTIKKIDLQGNEIWQEVCVCNRCKKELGSTDFVYETKWTAWHPVRMECCYAYGFSKGSNPVRHICENCHREVESFLEGKEVNKEENNTPILYTFEERVQMIVKRLRKESTPALKEHRGSFMCTRESASAIDLILKERGQR